MPGEEKRRNPTGKRLSQEKRYLDFERLVPAPRRLGERNELLMISRGLVTMLMTLGILLFPAKDNLINSFAFRFGEQVNGKLTGEEATFLTFGDNEVWRYFYSYTVAGNSYNGYSYSQKSVAEAPVIQVSPLNPALSKIKGSTYAILGGPGFWLLVVPILLLLLALFFRLRSLLRTRGFLIRGELVDAEILEETALQTTNHQTSHALVYRVTLPDGGEDIHKAHFPSAGYPRKMKLFRHQKRGTMRTPWSLAYRPKITAGGQWKLPPRATVLRAALWLAVSLLLVCWAAIRISLAVTG